MSSSLKLCRLVAACMSAGLLLYGSAQRDLATCDRKAGPGKRQLTRQGQAVGPTEAAGTQVAHLQKVTLAFVTGSTHGCTILHNAEKADGGSITKKCPCMASIDTLRRHLHAVLAAAPCCAHLMQSQLQFWI